MPDESDVVQNHFGGAPAEPVEPAYDAGPAIEADYDDEGYYGLDPADPEQLEDYVDERLDQALGRYDDSEWAEYQSRQQLRAESDAALEKMQAQEVVSELTRKAGMGSNIDAATTLAAGDAYLRNINDALRAEGWSEDEIARTTGTREFGEAIVAEVLETRRVRNLTDYALKRV